MSIDRRGFFRTGLGGILATVAAPFVKPVNKMRMSSYLTPLRLKTTISGNKFAPECSFGDYYWNEPEWRKVYEEYRGVKNILLEHTNDPWTFTIYTSDITCIPQNWIL